MKASTCYATVRLVINHPDDMTPEEVYENMDYSFTASKSCTSAEIASTEITDFEVRCTDETEG